MNIEELEKLRKEFLLKKAKEEENIKKQFEKDRPKMVKNIIDELTKKIINCNERITNDYMVKGYLDTIFCHNYLFSQKIKDESIIKVLEEKYRDTKITISDEKDNTFTYEINTKANVDLKNLEKLREIAISNSVNDLNRMILNAYIPCLELHKKEYIEGGNYIYKEDCYGYLKTDRNVKKEDLKELMKKYHGINFSTDCIKPGDIYYDDPHNTYTFYILKEQYHKS